MLLLNFSVLCTRHLTRPEYGYLWPSAYRAKSVKQLWDVDNNIFSFYCKLVIKFPPHIVPQMCIAITLSLFSIHWRLLGWKSAFAIICSIAFGGFFCLGFFFCIYLNTCTCKRLYNVCTLVLEENTNTSIYSQCWPTHPYFTNQSFYRISTVLDNCRYCPEKIILKFDLISVFEFLTWMNEFFFTTKC